VAESEIASIAPIEPLPQIARVRRSRRALFLTGLACLVTGTAVVVVGLTALGHVRGDIKIPLVLLGFSATYVGVDRLCKSAWGNAFDTGFWLCALWVAGLSMAAVFADLLPLAEYQDTTKTLTVPGNATPALFSAHPLGTNNFSLDIVARCIYGARVSLLTVAVAVSLSMLIGVTIGMVAGYFRDWIDVVVSIINDAMLSFPALILLIALVAVLGTPTEVPEAIVKNGLALALVSLPTMVRLSRATTMVFAERDFVLTSRAMGARTPRILFRELLPNVLLPVISYALVIAALLIVAEGSLAYLGLGLQQPSPTWGNMIAEGGFTVLQRYPHIPLVPGAFMFLTVFSFNRIGERARAKWDPRESNL
jgi:peptide/nickel transport system permease protein